MTIDTDRHSIIRKLLEPLAMAANLIGGQLVGPQAEGVHSLHVGVTRAAKHWNVDPLRFSLEGLSVIEESL
jgi:hypothetical protein